MTPNDNSLTAADKPTADLTALRPTRAEAEAAVGVDEDGAEVAVTWGAAVASASAGAGVADRCEAGRF